MRKIIETFKYYTSQRFSTIAGTLVYFLLMSIAPFLLWLTLVFGNVDIERFLSHELFNSISPFLRYLKDSAESAAGGAGLILLATSLYSSTNFFFHLRRSGEIIYGSKRTKGGIKLRIASLVLIILTIVLVALIAAVSATGSKMLEGFVPYYVSDIIICVFITGCAFFAAVVMNIFACPYKLTFDDVLTGSLLTTALWLLFFMGFAVYTQFARPERLYGRIASLIIFLIWCYMMMCCFVVGVINNGSYKTKKEYKTLM